MMNATYSPEDNKLRLYSSTRLNPETYARVRTAGFIGGLMEPGKAVKKYLSSIGRLGGKKGGKAKTDAKVAASRLNGKKGGRPPKPKE